MSMTTTAATDLGAVLAEIAARARAASQSLRTLSRAPKDAALHYAAQALLDGAAALVTANGRDLDVARAQGLNAAALDRLTLDPKRIAAMAQALRDVAALPDPVGEVTRMWRRPNGLEVGRVRVPIGVILMIYESRPNVTSDAGSLCLKAGNAVILRGGSEAFHSNAAIGEILRDACRVAGVPVDAVQVVPNTDRESIYRLLEFVRDIDLVIPRGGESLIRTVTEKSRIPVLAHDKGVCHVFVERDADLDRALAIALNAKVQRPGVCNAMETLLIDAPVAAAFLPRLVAAMRERGVRLKGCERTRTVAPDVPPVAEADYHTEYMDLILNLRVVDGLEQAAAHIAQFGSRHTDAIVTQNIDAARRFVRMVDSSAVMVNASTRFNDGGELGLGAEIGISTSKLHAFGPMGLDELTAQKFVVYGEGQVRG